jgi:hypothetical protein
MRAREKSRFKKSISIVVSAVLLLLFITIFDSGTSLADVIDQRWEEPWASHDRISYSIENNYPLGQEFTAGMDNITGVELSIHSYATQPIGFATVEVAIRDDTIQGAVLAGGTNTFDEGGWLYFDFGGSVPLSVGNRYVIEASMQSGSVYWTWDSWNDADGIGRPGRVIQQGHFVPSNYSLGFRTYAVPEPGTIMLLGLGAAIIKRVKIKGEKRD